MLAALVLSLCLASPAQLARESRPLAGAQGDFLQARYVRLAGPPRAIGRALAELARERHGVTLAPAEDPARTRAQRAYFERNAPAFVERMQGVAEAFGVAFDGAHDFASLAYGFGKPGCSVVYYPPGTTATGTGVVARNFDFTTGTFEGRRPGPGEEAVCAAPYVLELHPDGAYASLSLCAFDLLGGVVDGINSQGLVVALLADDEAVARGLTHPSRGPQAGFDVLQIGRHLLDTCADAAAAEQALLEAKLYYGTIPCHYLVADAHGRAFVWENSPATSVGYVWPAGDEPLVTTNFLRYLHPDLATLEERAPLLQSFCAIQERLGAHEGPFDLAFIRATSTCVSPVQTLPPPLAPGRTLWQVLYVPEERRLEVDFYLGDERLPDGTTRPRRSGPIALALGEPGPR